MKQTLTQKQATVDGINHQIESARRDGDVPRTDIRGRDYLVCELAVDNGVVALVYLNGNRDLMKCLSTLTLTDQEVANFQLF